MEVGGINVPPMSRDGNITQPLSDLSLQVDQRYNICVTAKNIIGHSSPGCNGSYIHMETEGTYISSKIATHTCVYHLLLQNLLLVLLFWCMLEVVELHLQCSF